MLLPDYRIFQDEYSVENLDNKLRQLAQGKYGSAAFPVLKALDYMEHLYEGKQRENLPLILHPLRVAWLLLELDQYATSKGCIAALLHETLCEQLLSAAEIEQRFGEYVLKLVLSVGDTFYSQRSLFEDEQLKQERWQEIMRSSHEVRSLRTFDDLDTILAWQLLPATSSVRSFLPHWLLDVHEKSLPLAHATNIHAYTIMLQVYENLSK
jgi:(p)ppGpp synthase/HD superfamily hydrolase